jgi:hypothetical protein
MQDELPFGAAMFRTSGSHFCFALFCLLVLVFSWAFYIVAISLLPKTNQHPLVTRLLAQHGVGHDGAFYGSGHKLV